MSPLIKAAAHGDSVNWGRIICRLGAEGLSTELLQQCCIEFQHCLVFDQGKPIAFDEAKLRQQMQTDTLVISVDLQAGQQQATAWGCDLSERYVKINVEYS